MDRTEAIKHLKVVLKTCDVQDEEAVEMAIKALEETHTLNGSTLTIKVSEEDIDKVKRIMLDYAPWCKVFYEDDKDINVPSKEIIRCKDCKRWDNSMDMFEVATYCHRLEIDTMANDFCVWAERKGDSDAVD